MERVYTREKRRRVPEYERGTVQCGMPSDAELDDSWAVTVLTGVLYVGWLSLLSYGVLWLGIEPLPSIEQRFEGWVGTAVAVGVGVAFIAISRNLYDFVRRRTASDGDDREDDAEHARSDASLATPDSDPPVDEGASGPSPPRSRKRKKKKKRKKKH